MRKAYAYVRTSTQDQLEGSGPERQLEAISSCAERLNLKIVDSYVEDVSGTVECMKRPVFREMILEMNGNGVSAIVVENLGRLARSVAVQSTVITYLAAKEIDLFAADTYINVTEQFHDDPTQKAMIQMMGVFFEWERDIIVARLQAGRTITGKKGGRPPRYPRTLRARIASRRSRGQSYGAIARLFNKEGIECGSRSGLWSGALVRVVHLGRKGNKKKEEVKS